MGESTDTYDSEGEITRRGPVDFTQEQIEEALTQFEGTVEQVPPAYSAKKINGRKAYEMARNGEEVELEPREIDVYHLELLEWDSPEAIVDVYCSSGTYVRSLANDLGEVLGCGGHLVACGEPRAVSLLCGMPFSFANCRKPLKMATGTST